MDIFKRITKDHRELEKIVEDLIETSGDEAARRKGFKEFVARFKAHAAAEEEVLYARLFEDEKTRGKAAHSVKEHEEARSLIEKLEGRDYDEAQWLKDAKQLAHDTKHHHEEEEQDTFSAAKDVVSFDEAKSMGSAFEESRQARLQGKK